MAFNQLTNAEAERLSILVEECSEVIQAVAKIQRHGYASYHPSRGGNNRHDLQEELGHVQWIMQRMFSAGDIDRKDIDESAERKGCRPTNYLHHQE